MVYYIPCVWSGVPYAFLYHKKKKKRVLKIKIGDLRPHTIMNKVSSRDVRIQTSRYKKKKKFIIEKRKKNLPLERHITLYCIIIYSWCQILYFFKSVDWNNIVLLYVYMGHKYINIGFFSSNFITKIIITYPFL